MQNLHVKQIVEAENTMALGSVKVVQKRWDQPIDVCVEGDVHHLELSMLPRAEKSRACFLDHWAPNRFEPIGELYMLPAKQRIRAVSDCYNQNSVVLNLNPSAVEVWLDREMEWTDTRLQSTLNISSQKIRNLVFQIGEEVRFPGFAGDTLIELLAGQVTIELSRFLMGIEEEKNRGGLSEIRLRLIDDRLADDSSPPSLSELAELCNLSVRQLTRAFRISRGRSIGKYIAEHRLEHAKRLLAAGLSVKSVAYSTGFSAPSNFTAAFVRDTGETPRNYRLRVKNSTRKQLAEVH